MLAGFDKPSAGLIKVFGFNLNEMKQTEIQKYRRSQIGFVWQESMWNLFPYLSVIENVMLPMNLMDDTNLKKRSEEHTSELQSLVNPVCRLLLEKKNTNTINICQKP